MAFKGKDVTEEKKTGFTYKGREIILSKTRGRPFNGIQKRPGYYSDEKRIEAATIFAATGSAERTGELTGVPKSTVQGWIREEWFQKLLDDIRAENDHVIDAKFNQILDKSLQLVMDRLEHGDFHVLRDGTVVRKPVGLRDLTISQAITIDKRQLLRNKPTSISANNGKTETLEAKLETLAQAFKKLAGKQVKPAEIIDVEFKEITSDESAREGTSGTSEGGDGDVVHPEEGSPEEPAKQAEN